MKKMFAISTSSLAAAAVLTSLSTPTLAQTDEIIITATKREQTLQEVPIAVSVTDSDTIEKAQIQDISDLQSIVPSLRVTTSQTAANTNFTIRGFGNGANNAGIEPSVGVFIDGVYRSRSAAQIGDLPNLERVEVLRGPQSTLFGKNASAGVISVISRQPQFEQSGSVSASFGNYNAIVVKGDITGPLNDIMAYSLSGTVNQRDGYIDNLATGNDVNTRDRYSLRGQLLIEPGETSSIRIIADYDQNNDICCAAGNIFNGPTGAAILGVGGNLIPNDPFTYTTFANIDTQNDLTNAGISAQADIEFNKANLTSITAYRTSDRFDSGDPDFTSADLVSFNSIDYAIKTFTQELRLTSNGENTFDWMIGGFYFDETVVQEGALFYGDDTRGFADAFIGDPAVLGGFEAALGVDPGTFLGSGQGRRDFTGQTNEAYSLFGTVDFYPTDRLTLTAGINFTNDKKEAYFRQINTDVFSRVELDGAAGAQILTVGGLAANFPAIAAGCGLPAANQAFTPTNVGILSTVASCPFITGMPSGSLAFQGLQTQVATSVAALDLSDPNDNPTLAAQQLQFAPLIVSLPNAIEDGKSNDEETTWTLRAAYDVTNNINIYASAATGFKATSFNLSTDSRPFADRDASGTIIEPQNNAALAGAGLLQPNQAFGTRFATPEEALVYELGLKGKFDWGSVNVAIFDQTIEGFQSNVFTGTGFRLISADEQSTQGVEVDVIYTPIDALTLTLAGTFLDPIYDSFTNPVTGEDLSGTKPAGIHETSIATSATYQFDVGANATGYVRADYLYESPVALFDGGSGPGTTQAAAGNPEREINVVNASTGITLENGFEVTLWGRNIFEDEYLISGFRTTAQPGSFSAYPSQPRTYGLTVRKKF